MNHNCLSVVDDKEVTGKHLCFPKMSLISPLIAPTFAAAGSPLSALLFSLCPLINKMLDLFCILIFHVFALAIGLGTVRVAG